MSFFAILKGKLECHESQPIRAFDLKQIAAPKEKNPLSSGPVVNAEFLQSLLSEYQQLAAKAKLQQSEQEYGESSCKK